MKEIAVLLFSIFCLAIQAQAQTYTQHLQQKLPGKGSITITQSKEIDNLVNGNNALKQKDNTTQQKKISTPPATPNKKSQQDSGHYIGQPKHNTSDATTNEREKALKEKEREIAKEEEKKKATEKAAEEKKIEEKRRAETQKTDNDDEEMNIPTVDMRKKVMRHAHKVTGFRVQAFAGGNTRADKQRAQQIGNTIKMRFPDQPVYVHFYSPRWICRVGNFRSYSEASRMLSSIRAMGYKGATIVKGKITVFE